MRTAKYRRTEVIQISSSIKKQYLKSQYQKKHCTFLTILPKDWSISRMQKEFPTAANYMIR
ncbi:hypothetical protein PR048_001689 [Dryococelus australis]|uniref:Uncharacterized protein n=1 Tax=Dryococelus australis TaxID=614101 RepID=A0ABQ9II19_9NEOP|nr:hypothetical protein PR048_001689 [Dryococelus australis]